MKQILIDREKLRMELRKLFAEYPNLIDKGLAYAVEDVIDEAPIVEAEPSMLTCLNCSVRHALLPSIEAEPIRHGKWIKMSDADGHYYACSECGNELARIEIYNPHHDLPPKLKSIGKTRYCPSCGAKMDEVNDEVN